MGLIPKNVCEETKMIFGLSYFRLMGLIITIMMSISLADNYVHSWFHIPFIIFCVVMYAVMNFKAPHNPKRRVWQGFAQWISNIFTKQRYLSVIGYAYKEGFNGTQKQR